MAYKNKEKQRVYQRQWVAGRKLNFFKGKTCLVCGSGDNLTIHHRSPKNKIAHAIWSWSRKRREEELKKCDILCEACHKYETKKQLSNIVHGTSNTYKNGCRCSVCREAAKYYQAAFIKGRRPGNVILGGVE